MKTDNCYTSRDYPLDWIQDDWLWSIKTPMYLPMPIRMRLIRQNARGDYVTTPLGKIPFRIFVYLYERNVQDWKRKPQPGWFEVFWCSLDGTYFLRSQ